MIASLQRIAGLTLGVALFALSVVTAFQAVSLCTNGQPGCLAAAVSYSLPVAESPVIFDGTVSQSSVTVALEEPSVAGFLIDFVQVTSVYLILLSVVAILVLELFELRYLRQIVHLKQS